MVGEQVERVFDVVGFSDVSVGLLVASPVAAPAPGAGLDQGRPVSTPCTGDGFPDTGSHGFYVVSVDADAGHAVAGRAGGNRGSHVLGHWLRNGPAIVLTDV